MKLLTVEEAAEMLHCHKITLSAKAACGEVPAAKVGRRWLFVELDLIEYLRGQYQSARKEIPCHSISKLDLPAGSLISPRQTVSGLEKRLAQKTSVSRRSITTS